MSNIEIDSVAPVTASLYGPNATHIKLVSGDGHEFMLPKKLIMVSSTLRNMIAGPGQVVDDNEINELTLRNIPSQILRVVCHYLQYKEYYDNKGMGIPHFHINVPEHALMLLFAAEFLNC